MFRGFNLELNIDIDNEYYQHGLSLYTNDKNIVSKTLNTFVNKDGSLNASMMQTNWFPQINANVFLSHSHADKNLAISLAGYLHKEFKLTTFVDSCIWGYADELLKIIDNEYCLNYDRKTYNYEKRNFSTSHVHMMLSVALAMMIDRTECLFFLNTPNSITPKNIFSKPTTLSPWIYSEIALTQLIRKKNKNEHRQLVKKASFNLSEQLRMQYDLELSHLTDINLETLNNWINNYEYNNGNPLDLLYNLCP